MNLLNGILPCLVFNLPFYISSDTPRAFLDCVPVRAGSCSDRPDNGHMACISADVHGVGDRAYQRLSIGVSGPYDPGINAAEDAASETIGDWNGNSIGPNGDESIHE
jgi:hypothetical protein